MSQWQSEEYGHPDDWVQPGEGQKVRADVLDAAATAMQTLMDEVRHRRVIEEKVRILHAQQQRQISDLERLLKEKDREIAELRAEIERTKGGTTAEVERLRRDLAIAEKALVRYTEAVDELMLTAGPDVLRRIYDLKSGSGRGTDGVDL